MTQFKHDHEQDKPTHSKHNLFTGILLFVANILPMEMLPLGEFDPVYRTPLDVQGGELPVLPLSIYGAVAMAYTASQDDGYVASNEFFLYKVR